MLVYEGRNARASDGPVGSLDDEGGSEHGGLQEDLKVQRSEEEVRTGVREREAGRVSARKSVHTEREVVSVPKRREEVEIARVPVEGEAREAAGADIGEDEVVLQVFEEEVVVTKRVVLKEEIRLRKRIVEDEEIVEVDLRKEEVEINDSTDRGGQQAPLAQERG
jgi:uncharacterized protein (TIGR02271 family)